MNTNAPYNKNVHNVKGGYRERRLVDTTSPFECIIESLFGDAIRHDDQIGRDVYSALCNMYWFSPNGTRYSYSQRAAGDLVAAIKGEGNYLSWYCHQPSGMITYHIHQTMRQHNWTHAPRNPAGENTMSETQPEAIGNDKIYRTLREANVARNKAWDAGGDISLSFRGNELAGEIGEALEHTIKLLMLSLATGRACNVMKKIDRERMGLAGGRATKEELADELADAHICVDLIAMHEDIDLNKAVEKKFNQTSEKNGFTIKLDLTQPREVDREARAKIAEWAAKAAFYKVRADAVQDQLVEMTVLVQHAEDELKSSDPNYTPLLDKYASDCQEYADRTVVLADALGGLVDFVEAWVASKEKDRKMLEYQLNKANTIADAGVAAIDKPIAEWHLNIDKDLAGAVEDVRFRLHNFEGKFEPEPGGTFNYVRKSRLD